MKYNFKPYLSDVFIETGTSNGKGVIAALAAGFPQIHSIELSRFYYTLSADLFENHQDRIHLYLGPSLKWLPRILKETNTPCTFWLDAHWCGGESAGKNGVVPLMDELKEIAVNHIKTHTILIDDMRLVRTKPESEWQNFPYTEQDIIDFIKTINPEYQISYEFGIEENDILVARI